MKKLFMLFLFISVAGCSKVTIVTDDFLNDLASEDNRIAGQLYLDVYNKNLDTLTYEAYMNYLKTNEALSAKGLFTKIQKARGHYFKSKINAFLITQGPPLSTLFTFINQTNQYLVLRNSQTK